MGSNTDLLKSWTQVVRLVYKKKALKGLVSSPLFGCSVTTMYISRFILLRNKMFLEGKLIIYINCSD